MTKTKKIVLALAALVILIGAFYACKVLFIDKPIEGQKQITVTVIHGDGTQKEVKIKTDEEYLRGALDQKKLVAGTEDEYGLFIKTVDGETVDDSKKQWWCITKGGEMVMTGVDSTVIADGDKFELTFKTGYDS
ncbi:MAG: DUF4430 domain-containing protein [Oscillospiraceae bacterium]|nr:DUF4430 domain-containing protein [Oscillospiraceae bacterium]